MSNLVHIRPKSTSNLLSAEKQSVIELKRKHENKKVAENQRLNVSVGQRSRLSNFLKEDIKLFNDNPNDKLSRASSCKF